MQKVSKIFQIALAVSLLYAISGCNKNKCPKGEGDRFERNFNLPNFSHFIIEIPGDIEIYPDTLLSSSKLVVLAQKNVLDRIEIKHSSGVVRMSFLDCLTNHTNIGFKLYVNSLEKISVLSAAKVTVKSNLYTPIFELDGRASTEADIAVYTQKLTTQMINSGSLKLSGYARHHEAITASSTQVSAKTLLTDTTKIKHGSFGTFECYAFDHIHAEITNGQVRFWGTDTASIDTLITAQGTFLDNR